MKATIFIMVLIVSTCVVFAQDTSSKASTRVKPPKPASKVGVMFGWQWQQPFDYKESSDSCYWKEPKGIGVTAFYNHTYDHNFFLQFGVDYNTYPMQIKESETKIETLKYPDYFAVTAGINWWCYSDKIYIGMGTGLGSQPSRGLFYLLAGVSFPIPKYHISIEANAKAGITNYGINIGLAYLLP